jgi:hypothetical protein
MKVYYPALITSAFFVALLVVDLVTKHPKLFVAHLVFSIISVSLMAYLSQIDLDNLAWGLLSIPLFMLLAGLLIGFYNSEPGTPAPVLKPAPAPVTCVKKPRCNTAPVAPIVPVAAPVAAPIGAPIATPITDISGSPIVVTPPTLTTCGIPGRTQCIDVRSLTSV